MDRLTEMAKPTGSAEHLGIAEYLGVDGRGGSTPLTDPVPQSAADGLAALAAQAASAPTAVVQLIVADGLKVIGGYGLPTGWQRFHLTPTWSGLAGMAMANTFPLVLEDIFIDRRIPPDAPARLLGARSYVGYPVRDPLGEMVGVCCVLDYRPRRWSAPELTAVDRAAQACTALVAEQLAHLEVDRHGRFLDAALESLHDGVAACDETGRVVLRNQAMRAIWADPPIADRAPAAHGTAAAKTAAHGTAAVAETPVGNGLRLCDSTGEPLAAADQPLARALRGEWIRAAELLVTGPGVRPRTFQATGQPITDAAGQRIGAVIAVHEVTGRRRVERFRTCELAVCTALAEATSAEQAGPQVLQAVATTLGWPHAELWLVHDEANVLLPAARWSAPGRGPALPVPEQLEFGRGLAGRTWQAGKPLWIRDIDQPQSLITSASARASQLHTALGIPVHSGRKTLGVLTLFAAVAEEPEDALVSLLSGIAAHVGQFLERRRAEELRLELARTKDEYLALLGHELRTPLTSVAAYAELLQTSDPSTLVTDGMAMVDVITRNAAVLRRIVDDLLDLAALDTGHATMRAQQCDLVAVVTEAVAAARTVMAAAGLTLTVDLPDQLVVPGDIKRLRQVLDNLLGNAIKFSPDGGRVAVTARRVDGHTAEITVSDTGVSVPRAERDRMFDRFYRSSNTMDRAVPGTGLSLAISRAIVERHHGTIGLVSTDRPGTTIRVHLPS